MSARARKVDLINQFEQQQQHLSFFVKKRKNGSASDF